MNFNKIRLFNKQNSFMIEIKSCKIAKIKNDFYLWFKAYTQVILYSGSIFINYENSYYPSISKFGHLLFFIYIINT